MKRYKAHLLSLVKTLWVGIVLTVAMVGTGVAGVRYTASGSLLFHPRISF